MSAFYDQASLVVVPSGYKSGKIYAQKPLTTDGQLTFTRASTATRVNASGLIETVSSGVPRLDYTNSSCPKILLEPQRTNLLLYSEQFDNAYWQKDPSASVVANYAISPDGTQNADQLNFAAAGNAVYRAGFSLSGAHRFTVYLKGEGANIGKQIYLEIGGGVSINATLTGEWQRFTAVADNSSSVAIKQLNSTQANSVLAWGAQLELGAYATSYIPTTTAAVTRLADAASKTGISSLIGQTEGTIYWEGYVTPCGAYNSLMSVEVISTQFINLRLNDINRIEFASANLSADFTIAASTPATAGTYYKIAGAYKSGQSVLYVNGVQIATSATTFTTPTLSEFRFNVWNVFEQQKSTAQALLFKTRLTNAQLAELTTL